MQSFGDVAGWLKDTTGADLEGVTLDEFRRRISGAVHEKGSEDVGVLAQVRQPSYTSPYDLLWSFSGM